MITIEEYCRIWEKAYARVKGGESQAAKDRDFMRMLKEAESASKNSSIAPHVCRITKRKTKVDGRSVTIEYRH